jgi:hypothetical protein
VSNITLPRAEAEQIRQALASGKRLYAALTALDAALAEPGHIHTCPPDCQKPLCVNRRREIAAAVEAEREACARVCDPYTHGQWFAKAIRARGSK